MPNPHARSREPFHPGVHVCVVCVYNIHVVIHVNVQYCVYMFTCITLCLLCLCFVLKVRNHWKSSRFFYGKNRVIQAALGRTDAEEYKEGLARVAKVFNHACACLVCAVLLCLVVLFDLACFFIPSHLSLKHVHVYM